MKQVDEQTSERQGKKAGSSSVVVERLAWQTASRDDQRVAQAIHSGQEIDALHELSEAGFLQSKPATAPVSPLELAPSLSTALLQGEGTARWRLRLKEENRDKVLVFVADAYGIFHLAELAVLAGPRLIWALLRPSCPAMALARESYIRTPV